MPVEKIASGWSLLRPFSIYEIDGTVRGESTRSETEVTGRIYGGGSGGHHGYSSPVQGKVESKTTRFQTIFLEEPSGLEFAAEIVDMIIPCREGHRVTLWRLGGNRWIRGFNHSTNQTVLHDDLMKFLFPKLFAFTLAIILAFIIVSKEATGIVFFFYLVISFLIGFVIALIPGAAIAWRRIQVIKRAIATKSQVAVATSPSANGTSPN